MTSDGLTFVWKKVLTGAIPFSTESLAVTVLAIGGGDRPPRPTHSALTDKLWALTQRCWDHKPDLRPQAPEISNGLYVLALGRCIRWSDRFLKSSRLPGWERLINRPHTTDERISLITDIFSDPDQTEVIQDLRGDNAQSFIDVVDEVSPRISS